MDSRYYSNTESDVRDQHASLLSDMQYDGRLYYRKEQPSTSVGSENLVICSTISPVLSMSIDADRLWSLQQSQPTTRSG
jgi:hypothetical protein